MFPGPGGNSDRTFTLTAVQGSTTMAYVTKAMTDYFASSGFLSTNIPLPSFTESQINDNSYKTFVHTAGVLPTKSCFTCTVTDSLFHLGAITSISFQDIQITDIILLNEDVVGSNIFNCVASGSLNPQNNGGQLRIKTDGFGINMDCHCGFDAGPVDFMNPYKPFDKTEMNEWSCKTSDTILYLKEGNILSINFKIDLGILAVSSFDSVVFQKNPITKVSNTLYNCDGDTDLFILASKTGTVPSINKMLMNSANKQLEKAVPDLLKNILSQNLATINGIIQEELGKIL